MPTPPDESSTTDPQSSSAMLLVRELGHDFNNLLSIVLGGLTLLREELPDSAWGPDAEEVYDDIITASREAADVVAQLTAWAGRQTLEPEVTDLNTLIRDLLPLLERALPDGIRVDLELAADPVLALVDRARLQHALTELVVNARDAMARGGHLRIGTRCDPAPGIDVSDSGEGMDANVLAQCKSPYFTTRRHDGRRGMGLSVVDGFARASSGQLVLRSGPGRGTRITLRLAPPPKTSC